MNLLNRLFRFYINSSLHVAISVFSLMKISELYLGISSSNNLNYFAFFGTITGYNFVKYAGLAKLHHRSLTDNLKIIQLFSFTCFILMLFFAWRLNVKTLLYTVPFGVLTLLYAIPFLGGFVKNLRNLPSVKILVIALVWSGITVFLPVVETHFPLRIELIILFFQRLLFIIVLTLPFDIRDFRFDKKELQTIPQLIGVERTKKLGFVLLTVTLFLEFLITPNQIFKTVFVIVFLVLLLLLQRATVQQKKYYASFWVEAIPIFWWILLLVFNL